MKIQKSRNSRQPSKDYSSVCHQQGRMLTDSDLTEQALIARDRLNDALQDVIGSGTPRHNGLIHLDTDGAPELQFGTVYIDGIRGIVRDLVGKSAGAFDYYSQLYYPAPESAQEAVAALPDAFRFYVDVWERSVTWLEDEMLRDAGLHGADTTTRTQTMAQVKWCQLEVDPLCADVNPPIGDSELRLVLSDRKSLKDPCDPCSDELELNDPVGNYLFRVEVHDVSFNNSDRPFEVVLKWSSENGAEAYRTADVPPDFASSQFVYEFFDSETEKWLGNHLSRDGSDQRYIDGKRSSIESTFSATSANALEFVRRWDGWCRIRLSGSDWQVIEGFEGTIDLTVGASPQSIGHVTQGGDSVSIELNVITLTLKLADNSIIAGDYWSAPVRESIHQTGSVLLGSETADEGVPPRGEEHHYMRLVDVADGEVLSLPTGSDCDPYGACQTAEFPSLTDLRADDICYDNDTCDMPDVSSVQDALDHLCQENDLRWHNRHLHGWGVVCGLMLECIEDGRLELMLRSGYALDCDGTDLVIREDQTIDLLKALKKAGIDPNTISPEEGVCLYLEHNGDEALGIAAELYQPEEESWLDRFKDSLLYEFYEDCIEGLINTLRVDLQEADNVRARCAVTRCGQTLVSPARRRLLTATNIAYELKEGNSVLSVSHCEHDLLNDMYEKIKDYMRSRTFCGQFRQDDFPPYPFEQRDCRATWFTPGQLDHIRVHPHNPRFLFGWERNSSRVYIFSQLKQQQCIGDLVGYFDVPQLEKGSITDVVVIGEETILVSGIVHSQDTLFALSKLPVSDLDGSSECEIKLDWRTSFMCGTRIVQMKQSPWNEAHLFAVGISQGVYLLDIEMLFENDKLEQDPNWLFEASGQLELDVRNNVAYATAYSSNEATDVVDGLESEETYQSDYGIYNSIALLGAMSEIKPGRQNAPVTLNLLRQADETPLFGSDGFVVNANSRHHKRGALYVATNTDSDEKRNLYTFDLAGILSGNQTAFWPGQLHFEFENTSHVSLAYIQNGDFDGILATRYLHNDLIFIPAAAEAAAVQKVSTFPVQQGPVNLIYNQKNNRLYILNFLGESISVMDANLEPYMKDVDILRDYRGRVIKAFYQLLSGLLQYIKDCFCYHLLIQCPQCDKDDKVYLGCVSIREGEIYNICNFTKRRYVKSFPTIAYWISLVPIAPLISWVVEKFCCLVLPDFSNNDNQEKKRVTVSKDYFGMSKALVNTDHGNMMAVISESAKTMGEKSITSLVNTGYKDKRGYKELVGNEYTYKPGTVQKRKAKPVSNEKVLVRVALLQRERKQEKRIVTDIEKEIVTLKGEKLIVADRFVKFEADYKEDISSRMEVISMEKRAADEEVVALKEEMEVLKIEKADSDNRLRGMEESLAEVTAMKREMQPIIVANKPVETMEGITPENLAILKRNRIRSVRDLANADVKILKELGMHHRTAASLVSKANKRIEAVS